MRHDNFVKYFDFKQNATWYKKSGKTCQVTYIVQELVEGGELFSYIAEEGQFSANLCRYYFKQLLKSCLYLHSKGFAHRDLKPQNLLLDDEFSINIIDFGFVTTLEGKEGSGFNKTCVGTPGYMAPELLIRQDKGYNGNVVDLYALAVILFVMYSGRPPFTVAAKSDDLYNLLATH